MRRRDRRIGRRLARGRADCAGRRQRSGLAEWPSPENLPVEHSVVLWPSAPPTPRLYVLSTNPNDSLIVGLRGLLPLVKIYDLLSLTSRHAERRVRPPDGFRECRV